MFCTVTVYRGEKIAVRQNRMIVTGDDGERSIPIDDLYSVVIDNQQTVITVPTISKLTQAGVHIIVCNENHLPTSLILSQSDHYRPLGVIRRQIGLPHDDAKKHIGRLSRNLPPKGSVRVMQVTEKQYNSMIIMVGERTSTEDFLTPVNFIEL